MVLASDMSWSEKIHHYMEGYNAALKAAKDTDFVVLFGMEVRFIWAANDYLLYGMSEALLLQYPDLYKFSLEQARKVFDKHGCLFFQAHPFRPNMQREDPKFLDGVETYNGNRRHDSKNDLALEFANIHRLLKIAGSDSHRYEDVATCGIAFNTPISSMDDMIVALKSTNYQLLIS